MVWLLQALKSHEFPYSQHHQRPWGSGTAKVSSKMVNFSISILNVLSFLPVHTDSYLK